MTPSPILFHLERGTLTRREWGDGHERACLLAALAPATAKSMDWRTCPAEVMPRWLAALTPAMDDCGTVEAWEPMVRWYADLASRWHVLDEEAWRRAFHGSLIAILEVARPHAPAVVDPVLELLRRPVGTVTRDEWRVVRESIKAQWATAAVKSARAAVEAVWAAAEWSAAVWAAAVLAAAGWAAAEWAAKSDAWDSMTTGILDAIEAEILKAEEAL